METPKGAILYHGPSEIDGKPIMVVATGLRGDSENRKTGPVVQVWIQRSDVHPVEAVRQNEDVSVCGQCKHRGDGYKERSCYVALYSAPSWVYRKFHEGAYPMVETFDHWGWFDNLTVRIGAYGDPASLPTYVLHRLLDHCGSTLAYTHQWRSMGLNRTMFFQDWCMASVDTPAERKHAVQRGWRTFRIAPAGAPGKRLSQERPCPADAGNRTATCAQCLGCGGRRNGPKHVGFVVQAHGTKGMVRAFNRKVVK